MQINLGIYVEDNEKELSVLVDRPVGGSSLIDGQIELMLHRFTTTLSLFGGRVGALVNTTNHLSILCRRLLCDDGKGVAEALNETNCIHNQCKGLTVSSLN